MSSQPNSLQPYNTLGLAISAREVIKARSAADIAEAWHIAQQQKLPFLILGEGSNVLFLEDFSGMVVLNQLKGITTQESDSAWHLHVAAGENWHQLVEYTLANNMPGLENLALIPGCAGSAPIQNIGAYGVELQDVCEYVDVLQLATGQTERLDRAACQFGYRDSLFKHEYQQGYVITAVGLLLKKAWQPVMTYGDLTRLDPATVTPRQIFDGVCQMRRSKLPDYRVTGNVGSFFKNPLVSQQQAQQILALWPQAPHYPQPGGDVKFAAGWLIDQCELKGYRIGGAAVHQHQALVLINQDNATTTDIVRLAHEVRARVGQKFTIWLEPEVRFIAADGEKNAVEVIA